MNFHKLHSIIEIYQEAATNLNRIRDEGIQGLREIGEIKDTMVMKYQNVFAKGDLGAHTRKASMSQPAIILDALSLELTLKGIVLKFENKEVVKEHSLLKLFERIPDKMKKEIIDEVTAELNITEDQFYEQLEANSNLFIEWRYSFEQDKLEAGTKFINTLFKSAYLKFQRYCLFGIPY